MRLFDAATVLARALTLRLSVRRITTLRVNLPVGRRRSTSRLVAFFPVFRSLRLPLTKTVVVATFAPVDGLTRRRSDLTHRLADGSEMVPPFPERGTPPAAVWPPPAGGGEEELRLPQRTSRTSSAADVLAPAPAMRPRMRAT